jgi:hypothetical protein
MFTLRNLVALFAAIVLSACTIVRAQIAVTDNILRAAEHVPACSRTAGLSGAGVAIPEGIGCILLNPAMFHSYNLLNKSTIVADGNLGIGEPTFERHAIAAGAGMCISEELSYGLLYRFFKPDQSSNKDNEITLNISGRLFDRSLSHGMVNMGINVRYERLNWNTGPFDTLFSTRRDYNPAYQTSTAAAGSIDRRRLSLDVGFYQDNVGEGLDFGLTLHDLMGYSWTVESPTKVTRDSTVRYPGDTITDAVIDSAYYSSSKSYYPNWQAKSTRRLTVGIAFHKELLKDKALIFLPLDLEILNLLDFETHQNYALHTGLEVWVMNKYCLRFGYARAPDTYPKKTGDLTNTNIFSGGAGVRISPIGVDLYIRQQAYGVGVSFTF